MSILNKFYDYTIQGNMGFKLAFRDVVVSVACHIPADSYDETMKDNGLVGQNIDYTTSPNELLAFTFNGNNVELAIFNQKTHEYLTGKYCSDYAGYDEYSEILYGFSPFELVDILARVRDNNSI